MFTKKDWLSAFYAALVAFCLYSSLFAFRKAFNVAAFEGFTLAGLDYKIILVITQVAGYMASKFYGIKFIASMKRMGRGRLILILASVAWFSWLAFGLIPAPYNWPCLFFSGFPLGMLWGVVFSYVEGRRMTDFISAALAVSFIFGSGLAKSVASFVMEQLGVSEYWMPFATGAIFALPLIFFVILMEKIPLPSEEDIRHRTIRLPMTGSQRIVLLKTYGPGLFLLVLVYSLVTILREVRDSFMADMWRDSGDQFNLSVFAQTETIITIILLILIASMVLVKRNFKALMLTHWIMGAGFLLSLLITLAYQQQSVSTFYWMLGVGLGLYLVYIPFNSILFDRLIASFRITGNVGFLIYLADSFGYLGSVTVLLSKSVLNIQLSWLNFYQELVLLTGIIGLIATAASMFYFRNKFNRREVDPAS
jgi:MFS family permease